MEDFRSPSRTSSSSSLTFEEPVELIKFESRNASIRLLNPSEAVSESMTLQEETLAKTRNDYILPRTAEDYEHYRDHKNGWTLAIFDGDKMIAQSILKNASGDAKLFRSDVRDYLGEKGLEIGGVMVHPDYRGNGLCEIMIQFATKKAKELEADYVLYRTEISNFYSARPMLRQEEAFIGHCEVVDIEGVTPEPIHAWSIFQSLNESKSERLNFRVSGLEEDMSKLTKNEHLRMKKLLEAGQVLTLDLDSNSRNPMLKVSTPVLERAAERSTWVNRVSSELSSRAVRVQ